VKLYIGVDKGDYFETRGGQEFLRSTAEEIRLEFQVKAFDLPPGSICSIWRDLASVAYEEGAVSAYAVSTAIAAWLGA
jgi:membrane-bound lytic murein transglycosylase MltF